MSKQVGLVSDRDGKLVLTVSSNVFRNHFAQLVSKLNAGQVDLIEVTAYDRIACLVTAAEAAQPRLPVGEVEI